MNNKRRRLNRTRELLRLFRDGQIPTLAQHEVHPDLDKGSRERYLYFTLPVCINFQRSSPAMWQSALQTWDDPETNYLFFPERVMKTEIEKVRTDLVKHKLGLQPNKHTEIWTKICKGLHENFESDPRVMIVFAQNDILKLLDVLQVSHRKSFPYLSGPKLSNYWPYILSQYTDVRFGNPHEISIIPDTHIIQSTIHLGLAPDGAGQEQVVKAWKELLTGSEITPADMHPVLWNWSRNNFQPRV